MMPLSGSGREARVRAGAGAPAAVAPVTLIGDPFGASGRAEHIRAVWRALTASGLCPAILDLWGHPHPPDDSLAAFAAPLVAAPVPGLRIFHLNGEEVEMGLERLEARAPGSLGEGYNIVFPAWELPRYPAGWARQLERFDEIWTASGFAEAAIRPAVSKPVLRLPNACEPHVTQPLDRAHFGLPEDRFLILFFFDLWSYIGRKNPGAVVRAFRDALAARPAAGLHLVLKLNHSDHDPEGRRRVLQEVAALGGRATLIDATLSNNEAKNLVRCCDCFLSLHRSEGFGRGPAEAMFFGKPVVATGWSGNMEYMTPRVSFPVAYRLVPVRAGEYPAHEGQVWAEPDVDHAVRCLLRIVDDRAAARALGQRARAHMERRFSDRVLGWRYRKRFAAIFRGQPGLDRGRREAATAPPR